MHKTGGQNTSNLFPVSEEGHRFIKYHRTECFTSCFAGPEDLNILSLKLYLKPSVFPVLLVPHNSRFEVQHLVFKPLLLLPTDFIATEKFCNIT